MTVKKIKVPLEEGLLLASATFGPILGCTPEEFYELMIDMNNKGLLSDELKSKLCHPIEFEKDDIKETITFEEALKRRCNQCYTYFYCSH